MPLLYQHIFNQDSLFSLLLGYHFSLINTSKCNLLPHYFTKISLPKLPVNYYWLSIITFSLSSNYLAFPKKLFPIPHFGFPPNKTSDNSLCSLASSSLFPSSSPPKALLILKVPSFSLFYLYTLSSTERNKSLS